ncbi:MAG: sensor histidine kinase [Actinomycetota bacterium]
MDIVYLVYGLAFLAMGLAIVLRYDNHSRLELGRILWLLAAFGFVHGVREWMDLWRVVRGDDPVGQAARPLVLAASFVFLFEFGRRLVVMSLPGWAGRLGPWVHVPLAAGVLVGTLSAVSPLLGLDVWSRYLLGSTGSCLAGVGFLAYTRSEVAHRAVNSHLKAVVPAFRAAGIAFVAYGVFGGLVVPRADWFPASVINQDAFVALTGIPVQLVRAGCAVAVAVAVGILLKVFHLEGIKRIQDGEQRLRSMTECAQVAIVEIDAVGRIDFWNPAAERIFGWTAAESLGRLVHELIAPPRYHGAFHAAFPHYQQTGEGSLTGRTVEMAGLHRDGHEFPVEIAIAPLPGPTGRHTIGILTDISERRVADAARRKAEMESRATAARLNLVLRTAAEGILGIDDERRIMFATPSAAEILGWPSAEAMQGEASHLVTGHVLANGSPCGEHTCRIRNALNDGETVRVVDESFTRLDGKIIPVEYVVSPLMVSEVIIGAVVVFHDISDRKELEAELKRSNAELEQFAYVASHDLRQPLRMITGYLSIIAKTLKGKLGEDEEKFIGFAVDGAKRMDALIMGLLEYSRVGRVGTPETVPLDEVIAEAVTNLSFAVADAKGEVTVAPGFPSVMGERMELMRLFQNLVGNAIKYRAPDRPPVVEVGWKDHGADWLLWVRDNGIGIAPDDHERAFKVFQRLVERSQYEGTGIGLAVCRKIVDKAGGRIWIDSDVGAGTTLFFTLPKLKAAAAEEPVLAD